MHQLILLLSLTVSSLFAAEGYRFTWVRGNIAAQPAYTTLEIGINIPAMERMAFAGASGHATGFNPYVSTKVRFYALFTGPKTSFTVPCYYMQEVQPNYNANRYEAERSVYPWRVRFAPPDTGTWRMVLYAGDPKFSAPINSGIQFRCVASDRNGWLKVHHDRGHLRHENGQPFFGIGQNIAWADEPVLKGHYGPKPVYIAGYEDIYRYMHELGRAGGNFVRIIMAPWSTGFEWDTVGIYDQTRAAALDSMVRIAEYYDMYIMLCIEMQSGYQQFSDPYGWKYNPYRKKFNIANPCDILQNDSANHYFKNKLRYIHARWGQTPNVAIFELLSEMTHWENYREHEKEFIPWHRMMERYLREDLQDRQHLFTTCFGPNPVGPLFGEDFIQLTSYHHYGNNYLTELERYRFLHGRNPIEEQRGFRRRWDKPFVFGEMGTIAGPVNACDPDDFEHCNSFPFHNSLWSTAMSGSLSVGLNWWQWKNASYRQQHIAPIARFAQEVQLGTYTWFEARTTKLLQCFYQITTTSDSICGWLHNREAWWGNQKDSCLDRSGKHMILPDDAVTCPAISDRKGAELTISGAAPRSSYELVWYSTKTGDAFTQKAVVQSNRSGKIQLSFPGSEHDYAFFLRKIC